MNASLLRLLVLPTLMLGCARAQHTSSGTGFPTTLSEWVDPSPHAAGHVATDDVRLHYLDWGGQGETILFLPGLSSSAHAFDTIAPRLTDRFRVMAMTPRAHGESSTPDTTYTAADAAQDILLLMDTLGIQQAHLVAHSISGAAITRFAALHPQRVGKLVFLDATFDYGGPMEEEVDEKILPRPWPEGGLPSAREYRDWSRRYFYGTWSTALEADMWSNGSATEDENVRRPLARAALVEDAAAHPKEYLQVRAPALALWAEKTMETHYFWVDLADAEAVGRAEDYLRARHLWEQQGVDRFLTEMPEARVVAFPSHHWVFITDEHRVLNEIRAFLSPR